MNERLIQFLAAENISQAQFADSINVARAGVSHIIAGRNKPSWDFILSAMKRYPTLNIEWLISGKGKMYKNGAGVVNNDTSAVNVVKDVENEKNGVKMEQNGLFGSDSLFSGAENRNDGEAIESEQVELGNPTDQPASQQVNQPSQQPATAYPANHLYAAPQPVAQSMNQPAAVYVTPQNTPQTVVKKPNVAKIIVFFDDGTFQECK